MNKKWIIGFIIAIILCGGIFYYFSTRPQTVDNPTHQLHLGLENEDDKDSKKEEDKKTDSKPSEDNKTESQTESQTESNQSSENENVSEPVVEQEPGIYDNGDGSINIVLDENEETFGE